MKKIHLKPSLFYYLLAIHVIAILFLCPDLAATDSIPKFSFNPHSECWPTSGWKTSTPEGQGMDSEVFIELFEEIKGRQLNIKSLLVVRNGYIVVEANRYIPEMLHPIYSSTKSVVSAVLGMALAAGHIKSVDQPVLDFFPEISSKNDDNAKGLITLKHLLTMSCGFDWDEARLGYRHPGSPINQMMRSPNAVRFLLDTPLTGKPGQVFNYNSGCSHLIFGVLDRAGLDVARFADTHLFAPLGIRNYIWQKDRNGIPNGSHGLEMTARDMAKFGYLYLKGGHWDGTQIVPEWWVEASTKTQIKMTWTQVAKQYGFKWYIHKFGFHSTGHEGQYIFVIPEHDLVVVFASKLPNPQLDVPVDLVKSCVLPAVKSSKPLPENIGALEILRLKSKTL